MSAAGTVERVVAVDEWESAVRTAVAEGAGTLLVLTAIDDEADGLEVLLHLLDVEAQPLRWVVLRTRLDSADPTLPSLAHLLPAAAWHERELHEMFGIDVLGHPGLAPLLLPPGFAGHPLRKSFPLAARAASWPGAVDPSGRTRRAVPLGRPEEPQ
jgi:NADH-quinone oxidoreductase subunit C